MAEQQKMRRTQRQGQDPEEVRNRLRSMQLPSEQEIDELPEAGGTTRGDPPGTPDKKGGAYISKDREDRETGVEGQALKGKVRSESSDDDIQDLRDRGLISAAQPEIKSDFDLFPDQDMAGLKSRASNLTGERPAIDIQDMDDASYREYILGEEGLSMDENRERVAGAAVFDAAQPRIWADNDSDYSYEYLPGPTGQLTDGTIKVFLRGQHKANVKPGGNIYGAIMGELYGGGTHDIDAIPAPSAGGTDPQSAPQAPASPYAADHAAPANTTQSTRRDAPSSELQGYKPYGSAPGVPDYYEPAGPARPPEDAGTDPRSAPEAAPGPGESTQTPEDYDQRMQAVAEQATSPAPTGPPPPDQFPNRTTQTLRMPAETITADRPAERLDLGHETIVGEVRRPETPEGMTDLDYDRQRWGGGAPATPEGMTDLDYDRQRWGGGDAPADPAVEQGGGGDTGGGGAGPTAQAPDDPLGSTAVAPQSPEHQQMEEFLRKSSDEDLLNARQAAKAAGMNMGQYLFGGDVGATVPGAADESSDTDIISPEQLAQLEQLAARQRQDPRLYRAEAQQHAESVDMSLGEWLDFMQQYQR